jgi:hypothetical protein
VQQADRIESVTGTIDSGKHMEHRELRPMRGGELEAKLQSRAVRHLQAGRSEDVAVMQVASALRRQLALASPEGEPAYFKSP